MAYRTDDFAPNVYTLITKYKEILATAGLSPVGLDGEAPKWMWAPADYSTKFPVACMLARMTNPVMKVTIELEALNPEGVIEYYSLSVQNDTILPFYDRWFKVTNVEYETGSATAALFFYVPGDKRILMPAFAPLESDVSMAPYDSCRLNATSLLLTNVSRVQTKQGTILAARLQRNGVKPWAWNNTDLSQVHPSDRYFGSCEMGAYTFTSPGSVSTDFRQAGTFHREITNGDVNPATTSDKRVVPTTHVHTDEYFNALYVEEEIGVDETILAITCDLHLEFRSTSSLFSIGISAVPLETYHAALLAVNSTGFFYENHTHWKQLASLLIKGLNAALPVVAPQLAGPVRTLATAAYTGYKAGKAIMATRRRNAPTMQQKQMVVPQAQRRRPQRRGGKSRRRK